MAFVLRYEGGDTGRIAAIRPTRPYNRFVDCDLRMVRAEIDPRVGGAFTFVDHRDGEDVAHTGTYLEIDRPRRLVFSFAVPRYSSESTTVTVEIVPEGTGCTLTLTHDGVSKDFAERTEGRWTMILGGLAKTLGEA